MEDMTKLSTQRVPSKGSAEEAKIQASFHRMQAAIYPVKNETRHSAAFNEAFDELLFEILGVGAQIQIQPQSPSAPPPSSSSLLEAEPPDPDIDYSKVQLPSAITKKLLTKYHHGEVRRT